MDYYKYVGSIRQMLNDFTKNGINHHRRLIELIKMFNFIVCHKEFLKNSKNSTILCFREVVKSKLIFFINVERYPLFFEYFYQLFGIDEFYKLFSDGFYHGWRSLYIAQCKDHGIVPSFTNIHDIPLPKKEKIQIFDMLPTFTFNDLEEVEKETRCAYIYKSTSRRCSHTHYGSNCYCQKHMGVV
jgi:hypothetical protein